MTSRERVLRCLEMDFPDRIPFDLWTLPVADYEHGAETVAQFKKRWPADILRVPVAHPEWDSLTKGDVFAIGSYVDHWGCKMENLKAGIVGEVKNPLLDDWSHLDRLRPPVEFLNLRMDEINAACRASDKYVFCATCPNPFERMQHLRGPENLYMDLAEESPEVLELLRVVSDFFRKEMECWAKTDVDALTFMDDWGSQRSLLINPAQWRRLFKPLYKEYAEIAHAHGKKLFMHSDGYIKDIYEDLIEIGVDAINSQLFCMDIEEIGRQYKGRITFWGEFDRQYLLPYGTVEEVRAAVRRVVENLYDPAGGVIAQFELSTGSKMINAEAVYETWMSATTKSTQRVASSGSGV